MSGEQYMREALELAARGRGFVSPNPMVGAVLVRGGRVVGRGWHRRFGGAHAEVEAIRDAGPGSAGATLYVTMEPCCYQGKTPACTDAVRPAGIRQVVAATLDPNPRVNGRGIRCLRAQGVRTSVGLLSADARHLNEAYFTFVRKHRPFVVLKAAVTLDGMIADQDGRSQWITGTPARHYGQELRRSADAIVAGAGTVRADDPRLTCRVAKGRRLVRVILDSDLEVTPAMRLFSEPGPVLVLTRKPDGVQARKLRAVGAEVVGVRASRSGLLRWSAILAELYRRGLALVLIEGGAAVASSALESGVVDKVCVIHAPVVLGPGRNLTRGMKVRALEDAIRLRRVEHYCMGSDMMTEGYVHRAD